mgnify:CR=1 FL=1
MNLLLKEPVTRVKNALNIFDKSLEIIELNSTARTALDAANALNCEVGAIVKSLVFRAEDNFILWLVSGDNKCSLNKLKKITQKKDVSMASPEQVKENTGYTIGGVSPVGHLKKMKIFIDETLQRFNPIFAAAGHPNCIFEITFQKIIKLTNGQVIDIIEWDNLG